jgi:hypothetical protein
MADMVKIRRETIRWNILLTLNLSRPYAFSEGRILQVIHADYPDATQNELRRELDYLDGRGLIEIDKKPDGVWQCELTRYGVDVVEYTVPVEPGIARPEKYWNA